jgi:hypothetical protein
VHERHSFPIENLEVRVRLPVTRSIFAGVSRFPYGSYIATDPLREFGERESLNSHIGDCDTP